jgi:hypothetical protein
MIWPEVRQAYSNQWLVIEALEAHTTPDTRRHIDRIAVIDRCSDGDDAMEKSHRFHQQYPTREFYFVHTSREELDIRERQWLGIRLGDANNTEK